MEVADDSEALIETLKSRGWCFRDMEEIKTTIMIQSAILGDTCTVNSLESELANMDFRSIGGKSLPDPSLLRKSSSLIGPKVLQISSVRDVCRSSIEDSSSSHSRRLFKMNLTDGHSEITAVEYTHIPSIPDDVIPGTKFQVFRGLGEVKLMRRSLRLAWQKASTVHEKIVFGAWLKYEKQGEELIADLLASCGKCALEFKPIDIASQLPMESSGGSFEAVVRSGNRISKTVVFPCTCCVMFASVST